MYVLKQCSIHARVQYQNFNSIDIYSVHVSSQITCSCSVSVPCHVSFMPVLILRGRLDWHVILSMVIQRSQKQERLGTYAFSISTIAVSQFSSGTDRVNLPPRLRVRE